MRKLKHVMSGIAGAGGVLLLAGCPAREQTVVVQPPTQIVKETTIKKVPQNKTIIVRPAPQPKTKTTNKVNVTVVPSKQPSPLPASAAQATAVPQPTPKISSLPTPKSAPRVAAVPARTPRPMPTVRPKPTATPLKTSVSKPFFKKAPLTVRAEITAVSKAPDPKKVAYKDSIVFLKYKVLSVENGDYKEKEIYVAHWGMKNKVLQPAARYRVGDVQTLQVEPLEKHPELDSIMHNDNINDFDLDPYWATTAG